jgi:hypothetical protein
VARRPGLDLALLLLDQCAAQVTAQGHRPQADHGMAPIARPSAGERQAGRLPRRRQARDQIVRQKRAIAGNAHDVGDLAHVLRRPVEPGQDAGERADEACHAVRNHRQAGIGKACRIAVGVDDHGGALRRKPPQNAFEDALAADADARLVAAAHATRQSASQHDAEGLS